MEVGGSEPPLLPHTPHRVEPRDVLDVQFDEYAEVTTPCFIAPGGLALLGAVALESLFLAVDPVGRRLVPVRGFVGLSLD